MKSKREAWRRRQTRRRQRLRDQIAALFPDHCQRCGVYADDLEFAHLAPTGVRGRGRGSLERMRDVIENAALYRRLCVSCHRAFDRGDVSLELKVAPF